MLAADIYKIIPPGYSGKLKINIALSAVNLVLDFVSVVLLVPVFVGVFNPGFHFSNINGALFHFLEYFKNNQAELLFGVLAFFILKNLLFIKITRFQSDYYYKLSNALSVNLLRNYFSKALLEVKAEKNSALVKDIVFVPNNFVAYVLSSVVQLISEALLLLLILLASLSINPLATLFLAIMTALIVLSLYAYDRNKLKIINKTVTEKYDRNFNNLLNAVNGYAEIKTNQIEAYFLDKFRISNASLNDMHSRLSADRLIKPKYTETFLVILISGLFLFSKYFSADYGRNILFISFLFASSIKIIPSVNRILIGLTNLKSNIYSIEILKKNSLHDRGNIVPAKTIAFDGKIELKDINFKYENGRPLLKDISLTIRKGEIMGIFGDSGNGKSTFINIITTLITPDSGTIFCDNHPVGATTKNAYLEFISYVPQAPFVLEGTILENLVLNGTPAKTELLDDYLGLFGLKETIAALPEKLNTFIGSNGYTLSGGQLQRLAIIRALIRKPQLLILDEATNQLDMDLRNNIAELLKAIAKQQSLTIIVVSHNKSELEKYCDTVYELKNAALIPIK